MHDLLHHLTCPHCWAQFGAAFAASFAIFGIGTRVLWGRLRARMKETLWNR